MHNVLRRCDAAACSLMNWLAPRKTCRLPLLLAPMVASTVWAQPAPDSPLARADRHALIIGVGTYQTPGLNLKGVPRDIENATRLARGMGVAEANITVLRDRDATLANIRSALRDLAKKVKGNDRVFVYYSGHGTRYEAPGGGGECTEGLVATDSRPDNVHSLLSGADLKADLGPVIQRSEKLLMFVDACHSGGTLALRDGAGRASAGPLPKVMSTPTTGRCSSPSNQIRLRGVNVTAVETPALANNVAQVSAALPDQLALERENGGGGVATSFWADCALESQRAGKLASVADISRCAQQRVDTWFRQQPNLGYSGQTLVVRGNADFAPMAVGLPTPSAAAFPNAGASDTDSPKAGAELLRRIHAQRDDRHKVDLDLVKGDLKIGSDELTMRVRSDRGGFLYLLLHSSDGKSTYLLFPNGLDQNNELIAGMWVNLPANNWRMPSEGPPGSNRLLAVVADARRDMSALPVMREGPFLRSMGGDTGLDAMAWVLGRSAAAREGRCTPLALRGVAVAPACSDAFGAALADFTEYR